MRRQQQNVDKRITRNQTKMLQAEEEIFMSTFQEVNVSDRESLIERNSQEEKEEDSDKKIHKQNIRKDLHNIVLLMFLYLLQGIPLGLSGSIPYILSSRKVSYADQGTFSFALWPFSLKLLWY
jgi:hypothetical protein